MTIELLPSPSTQVIRLEIPSAPLAAKVGAMEFQETIQAELRKFGLMQWRTSCVFEGPVAVELTFEYRPLASWSAKKIARTHWREVSPEAPELAALVLTALTGFAFRREAQVAKLRVEKIIGQVNRTLITVRPLA